MNSPSSAAHVAVIGYGYWGPNVAKTLAALLGGARVVVCESRNERRLQAAQTLRGIRTTDSLDQVLADPQIRAVFVCTPALDHALQVRRCLRAGKHVLVEKPLATTSREALSLAQLAEAAQRVLMVGHVFLFDPAVHKLRALLAQGRLGELRYGYVQRTSLGPRAHEDVNVLWDYLIHDIVIARELLGGSPADVRATTGSFLRRGIADVVFAELRYPAGFLLHCQTSWYDPFKVRRLVLIGSKQMALYDAAAANPLVLYRRGYRPHAGYDRFGNLDLELFNDDEGRAIRLPAVEPLRLECQEFLACCASGRTPRSSASDAIDVLRILEALETSLRRGRWTAVASTAATRSPAGPLVEASTA